MNKTAAAILNLFFLITFSAYAEVGELKTLNDEVTSLIEKRQYDRAATLAKQALDLAEKPGTPDSPDLATSLHNFAEVYLAQGKFALAEPLLKRALAIREKSLGPDHPDVARDLSNLATLYKAEGQYAPAELLYKRALAIREKSHRPNHPNVATALNNLALLYKTQGQYALAEPLYKRALAIREKTFGPDHPNVARSLNNLADLDEAQGQYGPAELLFKRALAIREKSLGPDHADVALSLNNLALLFQAQGRYALAAPLFKRALAIREKAFGPDHPVVAQSLNNFAELYRTQGQYAPAEPLFKRALAIREKALGPDHPDVAQSLNSLALLYKTQGQYALAEPLYKRALAIREKSLGPDHPNVARSVNNLAELYRTQGQYAPAELLFKQSLAIREKALGPDHPEVAQSLNNLALLYQAQGQYAPAEPLYKRSLAIREKSLGPDHPDVALALNNLAGLSMSQGRSTEAIVYSRRAFELLRKRFAVMAGSVSGAQSEQKLKRGTFVAHISRLDRIRDTGAISESFDAFQLAQASSVGQSVAQMAVRFAAQGGELAKVIRERQDAEAKLVNTDKALLDALGQTPATRDNARIAALREEFAGLEKALIEQTRTISIRFPEYDALVSPAPIAVSELQKLLKADEAMVSYLTDERAGTFAWVLRADRIDFLRLDITSKQLVAQVTALRSLLDPMQNQQVKPFDVKAANALYQKVFAPLEASVSGARHIILVPDGALQSLPFSILVDKFEPDAKSNTWLADRYAFSTIPSVAALRALRTFNRPALGDIAFVGFGNPVLGGQPGARRGLAARAIFAPDASSSTGQGTIYIADVNAVRQADPLPETADELRALAKTLAAPETALYLQSYASETAVKQMDLSRHRVIAFATHGVMAGEMSGMVEPGLILTPPKEGTVLDDGYLTASEVAQLKLSADWVLLSACNTAAPDGTVGAEGLSGLAKAFFYAGARSLLVSNWYVESESAVLITTEMLKSYAADAKLGKAEALRVSMQKLRSNSKFSHPLYWAPFTVVGEGGARLAAQ